MEHEWLIPVFFVTGINTVAFLFALVRFFMIRYNKDYLPAERYRALLFADWYPAESFLLYAFRTVFFLAYLLYRIPLLSVRNKLKQAHLQSIIKNPTGQNGEKLRLASFEEEDELFSKGLIKWEDAKSKVIQVWINDDYSVIQVLHSNVDWDLLVPLEQHGDEYAFKACENCKKKTAAPLESKYLERNGDYDLYLKTYLCKNCHQVFEKKEKVYSPDHDDHSFTDSDSNNSTSSSESSSSSGSSWSGGSSRGGGSTSGW
jgi:uncharacterized membrane protein YgcG